MPRTSFVLRNAWLLAALLGTIACSDATRRNAGGSDDDDNTPPPGSSSSGGAIDGPGIDPGEPQEPTPTVCAGARTQVEREAVYLEIALDDSGSMHNADSPNVMEPDPLNNNYQTGLKWLATRGALQAYFEVEGALASPRLAVGMSFMNKTQNDVNLALLDNLHASRLWDVIRPPFLPSGVTPMRSTWIRARNKVEAFQPSAPLVTVGKRAVLLITDGVPGSSTEGASLATDAAAAASAASPVYTAVIGVGNPNASTSSFDPALLSRIASVGGLAPAGCNPNWSASSANTVPCHMQVTPGAQSAQQLQQLMSDAIHAIAGALVSCELPIDVTADFDPGLVNVSFTPENGSPVQVPADPDHGWTYDDPDQPTKVILHGDACNALKTQNGSVEVVLGCPTGAPIN